MKSDANWSISTNWRESRWIRERGFPKQKGEERMSLFVTSGASLMCTFGTAPATLVATNAMGVQVGGKPIANIADASGGSNIPTFGMCNSLANPAVAAATAAALGVLTPQPCIPQTGAWIPTNPTVLAAGKPCVTQDCTCMCMYAGSISVVNPGQMMVVSK